MGILDAMGEEEDEEGCVEIWRAGCTPGPVNIPSPSFRIFSSGVCGGNRVGSLGRTHL